MNDRAVTPDQADSTEVAELLERRTTVEQWLAKLQDQRGTVSEKILERVRADYERRLRETLEALGSHRDALDAELEKASERLEQAEDEQTQAREALEEGRLRNSIGELDHEAWSAERIQLEAAVESAEERQEKARADVDRLRDLLEQFAAEEAPNRPPEPVEITAQPSAAPDPEVTTELPPADPNSFLSEIDRAISEVDEDADLDTGTSDELPSEETAPKPGLKCPECGYTNDLSAWFCGVCGADIG